MITAIKNQITQIKSCCRKCGFTLIELLVALSIFSVASVAIYSTFRTGIGAWMRIEDDLSLYQEARLALDRIALDLRNAIRFSEIGFTAEENKVSFPIVLGTSEIARVSYYLGEAADDSLLTRPLLRKEERFAKSSEEGVRIEEADELASGAVRFDLRYSYTDSEGDGAHKWKDVWETGGVPKGVKVTLALAGKGETGESVRLSRTVFIPTGTSGEEE